MPDRVEIDLFVSLESSGSCMLPCRIWEACSSRGSVTATWTSSTHEEERRPMTTAESKTPPADTLKESEHEAQQVERANKSGLQPVVFMHGLWLLPSSGDRWATGVEEAGYTARAPRR